MVRFLKMVVLILGLVLIIAVCVQKFWHTPVSARVIFCDVGQGDAILLVAGWYQALIDGGPGGSVIDCLWRYVPWWDRRLELVVLTHPDLDHFG